MLDGAEVVYLACQNGDRPLGVTFRIGMRLPAPYTATGKAMLSTLPTAEVRHLFADGMPPPLTRASVATARRWSMNSNRCARSGTRSTTARCAMA
jgi:DNA-binding IclR family transcriptional regulator